MREAQARCTMQEFNEWRAYWLLEPWGTRHEDFRAGLQTSILAQVQGMKVTPEDCMPRPLVDDGKVAANPMQEAQSAFRSISKRRAKRQ